MNPALDATHLPPTTYLPDHHLLRPLRTRGTFGPNSSLFHVIVALRTPTIARITVSTSFQLSVAMSAVPETKTGSPSKLLFIPANGKAYTPEVLYNRMFLC